MTAASSPNAPRTRLVRDRVTWVAYLALAQFTFFLNIQGNIIPFLKDEFDLSYRLVTLHPAAVAAGLMAAGLFGERLTRAWGRDTSIAVGLVGMGVGALLVVLAPHPAVSIFGCFLMGAIGCLILIVVPTLLSDRHGANSSVAIGEANGISYVASLTAALAVGLFVAVGLGWRSALLLGFSLGVLLMIFLRRTPLPAAVKVKTASTGTGHLPAAYWFYWLTLIGFVGIEQSVLVWTTEFLSRVKGVPVASAAVVAGAFSVGMLISRLSAAPVLARLTASRVLYGSVVIAVPAFLAFWASPGVVGAAAGLVVLGLASGLQYPLTLSKAITSAGPLGELATARGSLGSGLAILVVPWLVGAIADRAGLSAAMVALPAMLGFALVFLFLAERAVRR